MKRYFITKNDNFAIIDNNEDGTQETITYFDKFSILKHSTQKEDVDNAIKVLKEITSPDEVAELEKHLTNIGNVVIIEQQDGIRFVMDKSTFKTFAVMENGTVIDLSNPQLQKGVVIEEKQKMKDFLKGIRTSKENFQFGDRVLLYGPTGTGKTYKFLEFLKVAKVKHAIIPVTEGMEDLDVFNRIVPGANGVEYRQKSICSLLEEAEKGEKICLIFDELNRGSNSLMNLVLKALDPVDGNNYYITDVVQDRTYVIPQGNIIFGATVNLGGKYTGTNALDEALLDRFNICKYIGYISETELAIIQNVIPDASHRKKVYDFIKEVRDLHKDGEIRAPISTRGIKSWMEEFFNSKDLLKSFERTLLYRLVTVDDYGNPNEDELSIITTKFKSIIA